MVELVYSPLWFYGKDILIDIVSIVVLSLIGFFSIRYYKLNNKKSHLWFGASFLMIAVSFLFKILTNYTIYYEVEVTRQLGFMKVTYETLKSTNILFIGGFLAYWLLTLLGLYLLYSTYQEKQPKSNIILLCYFILVSTFFSEFAYYIFHLTALVLLSIISFRYYQHHAKKGNRSSKILTLSFLIIALSQAVFIFIGIEHLLYVIAEAIQLIGYILLLTSFLMVLYGKKKK